MASDIKGVRVGDRTDTSMELKILLDNSQVVELHLNSQTGAAIVAAIIENCPSLAEPMVLDFPAYGFATSPSAEGHVALAFKLSENRYPVSIRVPQEKLSALRADISRWEAQQPGRA
jgi:hypothetical protein